MKSFAAIISLALFSMCAPASAAKWEIINFGENGTNPIHVIAYRIDNANNKLWRCQVNIEQVPRQDDRFSGSCIEVQGFSGHMNGSTKVQTTIAVEYPPPATPHYGFWQIDQESGVTQFCSLQSRYDCWDATP